MLAFGFEENAPIACPKRLIYALPLRPTSSVIFVLFVSPRLFAVTFKAGVLIHVLQFDILSRHPSIIFDILSRHPSIIFQTSDNILVRCASLFWFVLNQLPLLRLRILLHLRNPQFNMHPPLLALLLRRNKVFLAEIAALVPHPLKFVILGGSIDHPDALAEALMSFTIFFDSLLNLPLVRAHSSFTEGAIAMLRGMPIDRTVKRMVKRLQHGLLKVCLAIF